MGLGGRGNVGERWQVIHDVREKRADAASFMVRCTRRGDPDRRFVPITIQIQILLVFVRGKRIVLDVFLLAGELLLDDQATILVRSDSYLRR